MNLEEFNTRLYKADIDLFEEFRKAGGLRGMFDQPSAEWNNSTVSEKIELFKRLRAIGFSVHRIAHATVEMMGKHGYSRAESIRTVETTALELLGAVIEQLV